MNAHPTAVIHPETKIADSVEIGPFTIIGKGVELGEACEVMSHVVLGGPTTFGKRNRIFPHACIGLDPQDMKYRGELTRLEIGDGNVFREFVTVHRGTAGGGGVTRIGSNNLLMAYAHVAHDCQLGDGIVMANGASLAGHVEIGSHAILGAFVGAHQFIRIGSHSFIGAFSPLNKDVLPYSRTSGGRPVQAWGVNRIGLERFGMSKGDLDELEAAFRLLCRSKLNTTQALEALEKRQFQSPHAQALVEFIRSSERGVVK